MSLDPNYQAWVIAFITQFQRHPTAEDAFQGGRNFERSKHPCPVCEGRGFVRVEIEDCTGPTPMLIEHFEDCPECVQGEQSHD